MSSTEIINLSNLTAARNVGDLVKARSGLGLTIVHVDNKLAVLAVGGYAGLIAGDYVYHDFIEKWNPTTETWTITSMKLSEPKAYFGIISLPTHLLCSL